MKPEDFIAWLEDETRKGPHRHLVHPPAKRSDFQDWQERHPDLRLPLDLMDLFRRANGIGLFDQESEPGGWWRIHELSNVKLFGLEAYSDPGADGIPPTWLALGLDYDCSSILTLDTAESRYAYMDVPGDPGEFEESVVVKSVAELLDWVHDLVVSEKRDREEP